MWARNQKGFSLAAVLLLVLVLGACGFTGWYVWEAQVNNVPETSSTVSKPTPDPFTIVAAGDIAVAGGNQAKTAALVESIDPDYVLLLGDIQYPDGLLADYTSAEGFDKTWGKFKNITKPAPGNHDYHQTCAQDYFAYFDPSNTGTFGQPCKGYYSFKRDRWLFLALDSECIRLKDADNCTEQQKQWIDSEIKANPEHCIAGFWHRPVYTHTGGQEGHGDSKTTQPFFEQLYNHGVSVVFTGHNHFYSRSHLLNGNGSRDDKKGIMQFIVGTGGGRIYADGGLDDRGIEAVRIDSHGVLKVEFKDDSFAHSFIDAAGEVHDSGQQKGYCTNE